MPDLPSQEAAALAGYPRDSPYQVGSDGRITVQAILDGRPPPAALYYPRYLAKQKSLKLGRQRLAALLPEPQGG